MNILAVSFVFMTCISNIFSLKLLLIFPSPAKSHYTLGSELGKGLARAGHEVTMVSSFKEENPLKNYKEIVISELFILTNLVDQDEMKNINMFESEDTPAIFMIFMTNFMGEIITENFFKEAKVRELLKSDEKYDAVIVEQFFNDAINILAYHFNTHLILFSPFGSKRLVNNLVGNPEPPSYIPDLFLSFIGDMTFFQRAYNFLFGILSDLLLHFMVYPQQEAAMKKYYPNAPDLQDLQYNVSLVLLNSHKSVSQPVPRVPNMVDIGGFHVNAPKELPNDLKNFMDNAKDGVIYFSMGSILIPSDMPKDKRDVLLKVLGNRKEKVLLKWDEDTLENKPDNMMISQWFPQQAILAHPKCKLFITHGGLLSTTETIYFGVPILAIPIFSDQALNAARAAYLGYGQSLSFSEISENKLTALLHELIENPSYRENAQVRSRIMHDRPVKPMDSAIYWIEYVVRHKGAPHLRVAGIHLPFYKYYMLDILATLLVALVVLKYFLKKTCRCLWNLIRSRKADTKAQSKHKKKRE